MRNEHVALLTTLNAISQFAEQKYLEYKGLSTTEKLSLIETGAGLSPVPYAGDAVATIASTATLTMTGTLLKFQRVQPVTPMSLMQVWTIT